jgi:hypothetical protein
MYAMPTDDIIEACGEILNGLRSYTLSDKNKIFKFADDTNLLVPEQSDISMKEEFANIQDWACRNKMVIKLSKTKEIVFRRPQPGKFALSPSI